MDYFKLKDITLWYIKLDEFVLEILKYNLG